jgi:hypothetical protein
VRSAHGTPDADDYATAPQGHQGEVRGQVHRAQHKAWSGGYVGQGIGAGEAAIRSRATGGQAQGPGYDSAIRDGQDGSGTRSGNADSDSISIADYQLAWPTTPEEAPLPTTKLGQLFVKASTKVATPAEVELIPLHVKPVPVLNTAAILPMMDSRTRERYLSVSSSSFPASRQISPVVHKSVLSPSDANLLVANKIASFSPSSVVFCIPFTIVEIRRGRPRRRFILWPKGLNDHIRDSGYVADVPLKHVSHYLPAAMEPYGACRDFACGFFQIPIPQHARHLFTFSDSSGRVLEMTRLPMGLVTAPELMHVITATLAGDRLYSVPSISAPLGLTVHCWIDNIRLAGSEAEVRQHIARVEHSAQLANATFSPEDSIEGTQYKFLGVMFNHIEHTVCCAEKLLDKLAPVDTRTLTIAELESVMGRVYFASAILQLPLRYVWWLLKTYRRRLSSLARGASRADAARLPEIPRRQLDALLSVIRRNTPRCVTVLRPVKTFTLYSDATLKNYGAVLIDDTSQELFVTAGPWKEQAHNINAAETRAVCMAINTFRALITKAAVHVVVDNTSTLVGIQRQSSKSFVVNAELVPLIDTMKALGCTVTCQYVKSADNPADAPSRGNPVDLELIERARGWKYER